MHLSRIILFAALVVLAGCGNQYTGNNSSDFVATAVPINASIATHAALREYNISPGDLLDISVFQVPDLTREVHVDEAGLISLPLIGDIKAAGMTVRALQAEITKRLQAKYMQSPQVSVFLKDSSAQHVTVNGAVTTPGVFPIHGPMTLVQALSLSGGISETGDPGAVIVFRNEGGQRMAAKFNVDNIQAGRAADPNLVPGDMIVVDTSGPRSAWKTVKDALPVFGSFAISAAATATHL